MEANLFSEYELSDYDLKILIIKTAIEVLVEVPNAYVKDLALKLNPNQDVNSFIKELLIFIPELREFGINDERLSPSDKLKLAAINLNTFLNSQKLRLIMEDTLRIVFSSSFLGMRYRIATGFIEKTLKEKTIGNPEILLKKLSNFNYSGINADVFEAINLAEKEISRVTNNEKTSQVFNQLSSNYMEQIEVYLNSIMGKRVSNMLEEVFLEVIDKTLPEFFHNLQIPQKYTKKVSREIKSDYETHLKRSVKEKFRDLRGGSEKREGFKWADDSNKIRFYEKVENLPKIKGKPMWDYAFENLNEADFDYIYIDYLKTRTVFRDVPESLFRDAVRIWQKYKDSLNNPKPEEKPLFFAFNYALYLLDFPETKYTSIKKYYGEGKKLSKLNNLNDESSK